MRNKPQTTPGISLAPICVIACMLLAIQAQGGENQLADKIIIVKSARTMTLLNGKRTLKTYRVALGSVPV